MAAMKDRIKELADLVETDDADGRYTDLLRAALCELTWPIARNTRSFMAFGYEGESCRGWVRMAPGTSPRFLYGAGVRDWMLLPAAAAVRLARMEWRPGNGPDEALGAIELLGRQVTGLDGEVCR